MLSHKVFTGRPVLDFQLTPAQQQASDKALQGLKSGQDVFVYAAAGAGKTEMTFASICEYLSKGKKVGFAISRRQVVLEIAKRLQKAFPTLQVTAVCEGHTSQTDGDIIVCTTHQLYRYPQSFDLLILDELDAFPFVGNPVLQSLAGNACKGHRLLLSATPDKESLDKIARHEMVLVELFKRPHGKPLCEPDIVCCSKCMSVIRIIHKCHEFAVQKKQVLVFVPRKADGAWMVKILSLFFAADLITSQSEDKDSIMQKFYTKKTEVLVCTTLLERGITVGSVQVLIYRADHMVFTSASLIQILGRVGRTFADPQGTGICYCESVSPALKECRDMIQSMNAAVSGV